ncbi:MAG: glycosyltransferase family 39 protein [Polyangiaceae bacterium]
MIGGERRLERACRIGAAVATVVFALAAFWELGDTFGAGHFASASAVCTSAENMWRWGVLGPVPHALLSPPLPSEFYCHHPWGIFWVSALFMKVLGHHAWACRLPAVLQSVLTVPALYLAGRALWSPVAGAVAALSFAALPIALSFGAYNSLEVPVIFGVTVSIWGYARFRQNYRRRFAALALGGVFYAVCCDWAAVIFAAVWLGALFACVFVLPRWTAPADRRRLATVWVLGLALCALAIGAHLYVFAQLGQLDELFNQGNVRSTGSSLPLGVVLSARKFWIDVSFTGLAIALGKIALPVLGLRVVLRRSDVEALPLAVFAMAAFQYVVFKQGADIHIFWPHYFALYFALAWAGLIHSALELLPILTHKFRRFEARWAGYAALGLGALVPLSIFPDGLRALAYAHRSGGRFNENGHLTKPDKDKVAALEWLTARMANPSGVVLHPGMRQSLWVDWSLQRPVATVPHFPIGPSTLRDRYYIADLRFMGVAEQEELVQDVKPLFVGPFLVIDRAAPAAKLTAFTVQRVAPSLLQAYWVSSSHALRRVEPDPYATWELRDRFDLVPNDVPTVEPRGFEELRIAHNIAISIGDSGAAARYRKRTLAGILRGPGATFANGDAYLGSRLEHDGSQVLTIYFSSAGPDPTEPELFVRSRIQDRAFASLVPSDPLAADVAMPFVIPASRWKRNYIYSSVTEVIARIGSEVWTANFRSTRGATSASSPFEVLYLE